MARLMVVTGPMFWDLPWLFAAGSVLVFFPILTVLQALVVDRLRIRAR